jgi:predicted RNase H-like nuclease (RuvC/YqgF family)
MIKTGASMAQLIGFLRNETERISLQLAHLELIQDEYTNDIQTQKYREALENVSRHNDKLKNEISELRNKVRMLKNQIINDSKNAN